MTPGSDKPLVRRVNTRSRTGCVACREKHIRCDERRPSCLNCQLKKQSCSYMPKLPLRERRAGPCPGQQAPWAIQDTRPITDVSHSHGVIDKLLHVPSIEVLKRLDSCFLAPGEALDPFDTLPINMPLRSKELLHYFFQAGHSLGSLPGNPDDCIASATSDPNVLQNTILISGLHYAWNKGDLYSFEPTFIFHKIQSIRKVNTWLGSTSHEKDTMRCAKYISTLCFIECCLGNFDVAESHLSGLMIYLNSQRAETDKRDTIVDVDIELTNRYLILAYNVVHSLKSRLDDFLATHTASQGIKQPSDPRELAHLIHQWHVHEASGLGLRLKALRMVPFFFGSVPTGRRPKDIDVYPIITVLKDITKLADLRHVKEPAETMISTPWKVWDSGGPSRLLFAVISAHIQSFSDKIKLPSQGNQAFLSSWSGFCVAIGMYLITVLGIWNQGLPVEKQLNYHILRILTQDIKSDSAKLQSMSRETRDILVWKAFIGSLSVVHAQSLICDERLDLVLVELTSFIQEWTKITGIVAWSEAREVLNLVVWPSALNREGMFEALWVRLHDNE